MSGDRIEGPGRHSSVLLLSGAILASPRTIAGMLVRALEIDDADAFHELRLRGLEESPDPFLVTLAEDAALSMEYVRGRFPRGGDAFALGAFDDGGRLVGIVGFSRETRAKVRHRGDVWGMYVAPEARGMGAGRALMEELVRRCREMEGLEQVVLEVATGATAACRLYSAVGFETIGEHRESMKDGERYLDTRHMVLRLRGENLAQRRKGAKEET